MKYFPVILTFLFIAGVIGYIVYEEGSHKKFRYRDSEGYFKIKDISPFGD